MTKGFLFLVALIGFSCVSNAQKPAEPVAVGYDALPDSNGKCPSGMNLTGGIHGESVCIRNVNGDVHVKDEVAHAHPAAPAPTTKEVPAPADQQVAILKAQRSVQSAQLLATDRRQKATDAEQKAEQQDEANLKQALAELNAAVDKARTELKLPANTPFDQMKLAFTPPAK